MVPDLDDKLFINKLKHGEVLSFDNIFKKYHKKVYYFAISYLKNKEEAEDVVQEVFMNLWKYKDQINEYYVFSKYLFKITFNATCKRFRKLASDKKHLEEALKNISIEDNSTILDIEYDNLLETANRLIQELPSRQRNILILSIEEHLSTEQIAQKMKISKKTVNNYLAMAKTSLKKTFADIGILSSLFIWLFLK
ncbi:MAG: sigma-70 family RNA polymerase sigma factor [Bacteroidota bacterium]